VRVLILGSGGREHAVAWKLRHDDPSVELTAAPGNPGLEQLGRCASVSPTDVAAVVALAEQVRADLVFVGPEAPLAAGVADGLRARGVRVFGPSQAAARLESSKRFAKQLMLEHGIPTAGASWYADAAQAKAAVELTGAPVVIKASGLAAGKGVVVASSAREAHEAIDAMMLRAAYGAAGSEVLVEEFMSGEELSVFAVCDGTDFVLLPAAQDHKRLLDGDRGPNTGGMGAYAPVSLATSELLQEVAERIIGPTLAAMRSGGAPFSGLLYCGLMLTEEGPKVVEFNCRFGDPETEAVLPVMDDALLPLLLRSALGELGASADLSAARQCAVTTVVAAPGYPESPETGARLEIPVDSEHLLVFHAGTGRNADGALISTGGRVVAVTGVADDFETARQASRDAAARVVLPKAHFRTDIGWREAARRARTPGN
jgi:phosphoribosylamine--glycine ligase